MRMAIGLGLLMGILIFTTATSTLPAKRMVSTVIASPTVQDEDNGQTKAFRAGRGSFRSPRSGYTGGVRGQRPDTNAPVNRTPANPTNRFGGFFGGILAGTLLGSLLNPFGFGGTGGFSFIGLLFWGLIIYFVFRFLRKRFGGRTR
ncbi:hypothetical protein [Cohnella luojiensis]|uniref:Uncharacterized protein n=1 Tax=Cohnella luojiensis TaxID=652876 RepID=A0A4Y8LXZ9_9BACL|nr:hypothetical protein [Cohnella luojiensis]TFE26310.1 hypothetical protein E2980_11900 [Cohnella luojiensis]